MTWPELGRNEDFFAAMRVADEAGKAIPALQSGDYSLQARRDVAIVEILRFLNALTAGATNDTLRYNGTAWIASSFLRNTGASVLVGGPLAVVSLQDPATPEYTFDGDTNMGMYQAGLDRIGFATAGLARWEISAAGALIGAAGATIKIGANQVVGAQQAANADTSGATLGQLETEVNELKAALRAHGLIAT